MILKQKVKDVSDSFSGCDPKHKKFFCKIISNYDDLFQEPTWLPPKKEIEHEIHL